MGRLTGKSAVITGAGSGIGRASALLFASEGAKIVAVDLTETAIEETAQMVRDAGGEITSVTADVGDEASVKAFIDLCVSKYGALDILFANAGISGGLVPMQAARPTAPARLASSVLSRPAPTRFTARACASTPSAPD